MFFKTTLNLKGDIMRRIVILLFFPIVFIGSLPYLLYGWVVSKFNRQKGRKIAYSFTRFVARSLMKLSGADYQVSGLEHIDESQNYLFVGNHRGLMDTPTLMVFVKQPLAFISKKEMAKVPILKQWMTLLGCLFLDRSNNRAAIKTILQGIDNLKDGDNVAIFPQGTRSMGDDFLPFKAGSFKLATKSGTPIIPVSIKGTDVHLENNGFNVKPCKIYVHFHEPIQTTGMPMEVQKELPKHVATIIKETYDSFGEC